MMTERDTNSIYNVDEVDNIIHLRNGAQAVTYEDIHETIKAVADKYEIDLKACKQPQYVACLREGGAILFPKGCLFDDPRPCGGMPPYDYDLINQLADVFIQLSNLYGRFPTPYAFSAFTHIPYDNFMTWQQSEDLTDVGHRHIQKVLNARNEAITDKLFDSNNVTGQAMLANNILGWATSNAKQERTLRITDVSTLEDDYKSLGLYNNLSLDDKSDD